jgi:hypothetical protein
MAKNNQTKPKGCLICGKSIESGGRGLCSSHFNIFVRHRKKLTEQGRIEFEDQLVAEGKLLPSRQGKRSGVDDPFEESVKKLIQKNPSLAKSVTESLDSKTIQNHPRKKLKG